MAATPVQVTVPAVRRNVRGALVPVGLWLLLTGGRVVCRAVQRCARLVPYAVPLPAEDAELLLGWQVR